jgi:hypothetical protein
MPRLERKFKAGHFFCPEMSKNQMQTDRRIDSATVHGAPPPNFQTTPTPRTVPSESELQSATVHCLNPLHKSHIILDSAVAQNIQSVICVILLRRCDDVSRAPTFENY